MVNCAKCGAENPGTTPFCGGCGAVLQPPSAGSAGGAGGAGGAVSAAGAGSITIGSAADCDLVLADPTISGHHLRLSPASAPGRFVVEDLGSSNGTYVRGSKLEHPEEVGRNETIQLGLRPVAVASLAAGLIPQVRSGTGRTVTLGRTDDADIVLPYPMVSGRHAELRLDGSGLSIRDVGSTNGTFVDGVKASSWTQLGAAASLSLGTYRVPPSSLNEWRLLLSQQSTGADPTSAQVTIPEMGEVLLGRDPECEIVIDRPQISWRHARITSKAGKWVIKDLGSANGIFVNGSRVKMAKLHTGDQLHLGSVAVKLEEGRVAPPKRYEGKVRLDAEELTRKLDSGKIILDGVSLSIYPGELVALMGPSGAGKSTLLEMLTGLQPPSMGRVLFNGKDLHAHAAELSDQIGYVPQDDVMHQDLTVYEVLYHAAVARLPADLPDSAIRAAVDRVVTQVAIADIKNNMVGGSGTRWRGISGGQRKRVNIALELITEPPLLFLDEPTSGLASSDTLMVLQVLRTLADSGTTIVMTIHQPRVEAYEKVDQLLLLAKDGKLAYFGPADASSAEYFAARSKLPMPPNGNPADFVIDALEPGDEGLRHSPDYWQQQFRSSPVHKDFVVKRLGSSDQVIISPSLSGARRQRSGLHQFRNLFARYSKRWARDPVSVGLQVAQPIIVGLLLGSLFSDAGMDFSDKDKPASAFIDDYLPLSGVHVTLFLLAAAAFWFGCSNVARELVADRSVFKRERRAGLPVVPYLASVYTFQVAVTAAQTLVMLLPAHSMVGLEMHAPSAWLVLLGAAASGVGLGLLVSAFARTVVTAISWVPLILLPELMLSGYLNLYRNMAEWLQGLSQLVHVRWAFEGLARLELNERGGVCKETVAGSGEHVPLDVECVYGFDKDLEIFGLEPWAGDVGILLSFAGLFLVVTLWRLATEPVKPGD